AFDAAVGESARKCEPRGRGCDRFESHMFQIFCSADVPGIRDRKTSAIVQVPKFSPLLFDGWHIVYSIIHSSHPCKEICKPEIQEICTVSGSLHGLLVCEFVFLPAGRSRFLAHYYEAAEDCPSLCELINLLRSG